jgi:hypothetical protein
LDKGKKHFIKQFQTCRISISTPYENPLSLYIAKWEVIKNEEIKPPTYYEYRKKKKGIDTIMITKSVNHSCHHSFSFIIGSSAVDKSADTFDLDYSKFDTGQININYEYNQRTELKALIAQLLSLLNVHQERFQTDFH